MSDNIPFEMQVEIMKRLPVKSLAVSRSVSKAWKSMIDSPIFVTDYTNLRQHHRLLLRYELGYGPDPKYISIMDNDTFSQHKFDTIINVPESFEMFQSLSPKFESAFKVRSLTLVGSSQGLLCLLGNYRKDSCYKETAVIWNPSLRKYIAIDVSYLYETYVTVLGFGVRPDNNDPMIVMINGVEHLYPVMVFTLSSRVWRIPRGNLPPKSINFTWSSPVADDGRCIYWKAFGGGIYLIVSFDMMSEDFTEINIPHSVAHRSFEDFSISKIRESLALLEYCDDAETQVYAVWMMMEDGVSKSFTKLFTINTPFVTNVLGFRKNDQPIMETSIDDYGIIASLEVYEPRTGTIKNVGIDGLHDSFFLCSYTETLLLLDQLDEQFVKIQLQL